ncbi:hypothetical protein QPK87_08125 [Kamptonema cortianum]|uniref:Uncharacterized protein n=1 Tax=Geitlerinema calcuttense NRMC-F 0142 TaxID=2922238 RepID=A0ABT7M003_9CYAN|nr:hypothetical protein [Geitlerinema calcuttense]MCD8489051.1 hypothetical protein [Desertifilum sp.]MDK3156544.1 hypothetical protein [Kamptonema cortianum]MDL5057389.1 hypothetical protein [Geitlerinema calcuttense NRMC-F 0142]
MNNSKNLLRSLLYLGIIFAVIALVIMLKRLLIFVSDEYIYPIPLLGDLLRGIEIVELSNIILFAVLGLGFGMACGVLPRHLGRKVSLFLLIPIVPILFNITGLVRYREWLREVGAQESLLPAEVQSITNDFLHSRVGKKGYLGFYLFTAQYPVIPTNQQQMEEMQNVDNRVKARFNRMVGSQAWIVNFIFAAQGWILRLFYFAIAAIATIFHFQEGVKESEKFSRKRPKAQPPSPQARVKKPLPQDSEIS